MRGNGGRGGECCRSFCSLLVFKLAERLRLAILDNAKIVEFKPFTDCPFPSGNDHIHPTAAPSAGRTNPESGAVFSFGGSWAASAPAQVKAPRRTES